MMMEIMSNNAILASGSEWIWICIVAVIIILVIIAIGRSGGGGGSKKVGYSKKKQK